MDRGLIRLKSVVDDEESRYEYPAEYRNTGNSHTIVYTDYAGNAATKVCIEAAKSAMLLHRVGAITADMRFDPSADTFVAYDAMSLRHGFTLHTYHYQVEERDNGLSIFVEYGYPDNSASKSCLWDSYSAIIAL